MFGQSSRMRLSLLLAMLLATPILAVKSNAENTTSFDFVIIGGGTAGLTLASRLSAGLPSSSVLVLEAGPDARNDSRVYIPGRRTQTFNTPLDWNFTTVPLPYANNRRVASQRARMLGGCSGHNIMLWDRGSIAQYDAWETMGNPGWNWDTLYPAMLKAENYTRSNEVEDAEHAVGGPIQSTTAPAFREFQVSFLQTMGYLGLPATNDSISGHPLGVSFQPSSVRRSDWTRSYAVEYIKSPPRNLIVKTDTRVARIHFDNDARAAGVSLKDGTHYTARKEIILSAGVYQSPQLLELSGIGNITTLQNVGIANVVYDLPGVGENLQDHARSTITWRLPNLTFGFDRLRYDPVYAAEQLALWRQGVLSEYGYTGTPVTFQTWSQTSASLNSALLSLADETVDASDPLNAIKLSFLHDDLASEVPQAEILFADGYGGVRGYPAANSSGYGRSYVSITAGLMHGFSRGSSHIRTSSVEDWPAIDLAYLSHPYDRFALREMMKYVRHISQTPPFAFSLEEEVEPGLDVQGDDQWDDYVRNSLSSFAHPSGTCAMKPEAEGGVVSPELKVYGTKGLRVVDASIIPVLVSGHIQTLVYGIAERAAEIMLEEWKE